MAGNLIKLEGLVIEALPSVQFMVKLENGEQMRAYLSGKMNLNHIKVLVGDKVVVETNQDFKNNIGRIILRK